MVDTAKVPIIDPTKNVLDLVEFERKHRDTLRTTDLNHAKELMAAETRRVNERAELERTFNLEMAKVLRANQDAASTLLATQLKEVKNDLSDRTAKLEQFRWETGGKTQGIGFSAGVVVQIFISLAALATVVGFVITHGH
jgi:hypothetical protein